jgi:broad specificity phosphatase PhoE
VSGATTLFLLRHAAHDLVDRVLCGRMPGVRLGTAGREQATRLGLRMAREPLLALYTSPQPRARETAQFVAAHRPALPVVEEPALDEIAYGAWTGLTFAELADDRRWRRWNAERANERPPGGESMIEAQSRALDWAWSLPARHGGEAVAAVSHADVIKAMLAGVLGLPLDRHDRFDIAPASVSAVVLWRERGGKVLSVNEAAVA